MFAGVGIYGGKVAFAGISFPNGYEQFQDVLVLAVKAKMTFAGISFPNGYEQFQDVLVLDFKAKKTFCN